MEKNLYLTKDKEGVSEINYQTSWEIYPEILKRVKIKDNEKILDAGCGKGEFSKWIKKGTLIGLDFRKDLVDKAKKRVYQKVILGNIENLGFKDKDFDKTFSIEVFQYLENPQKAFEELTRVTKNQIILTIPNFNWLKIKSLFGGIHRTRYKYCLKNENYTNIAFLKNLKKNGNSKLKIYHLSNRYGKFRNIFGNFLSSEIMGVYNLK